MPRARSCQAAAAAPKRRTNGPCGSAASSPRVVTPSSRSRSQMPRRSPAARAAAGRRTRLDRRRRRSRRRARRRLRRRNVGAARRAQRQIESRQRAADGCDPAGRVAADSVHLEKRAAQAAVLDQRRGGIERVEDLAPDPRVERWNRRRRCGRRGRRPGPGPASSRAARPAPPRSGCSRPRVPARSGRPESGFLERDSRVRCPRHGEPEGRNPDAHDRHGSVRIANICSIRQAETYLAYPPLGGGVNLLQRVRIMLDIPLPRGVS